MQLFAPKEPILMLYLVAGAWMFVVVLMAGAEAVSREGSGLAALLMLMFYGVLPLSLLLYLLGTPMRRRARHRQEDQEEETEEP
ncbi:MAG TPA: hypothetical protein VGM81_02525 [Burkholderiaceae bacterium]